MFRRILPIALLVVVGTSAFGGAPADRASLNPKGHPLELTQWLAEISARTDTPTVLFGPVGSRRTDYVFVDEPLGDALDDLCSFYGCTWSQESGILVLRSRMLGQGLPLQLAEWLEKRRKSATVPAGFQELLILSAYPDDVLAEAQRIWPGIERLIRGPLPYRIRQSLTSQQAAKAALSGLSKDELSAEQLAMIDKFLKQSGEQWDWAEGSVLRSVTEMSESDQSPRFVRLDLSRKTERIERTLPILIGSIPPQIPTYGELPPLPKQAPDEGVCKLTVSGAKVDAEVRKTRLQVFLQKLSGATDEKLSAEWALQAVPVAVFATGADRAALREAIATAADASWEADGTGKLLVAKPSKKPNAERPPGPGDLLRKLFWVTSLDDAERQMAYACDRRLFGQSTPISFVASAIRLLQLTDPAAPEHADKPGELRLKAAWLSEEAMGNLMRVSQRLKWDETMQPVYDRTVLEDPRTTIKFTWDGKGNYHLDVRNPSLENLDALTCNFGLDVMQYDSDFVLAHFSEQPWFLKFPTDAPKDYLEYLERTRAWRGKLALKHIAPLAFIPEAKWLGIRKKVPEFEAVTPANRRAMHLYAVLDHALRQKSCGDGMKIQQQREVWTINWLARAVVSAANIKFTTWGKDDKLRLVTESGVVQAVEFSSAGRTLRFAVPKADELLGKEGCLPAP